MVHKFSVKSTQKSAINVGYGHLGKDTRSGTVTVLPFVGRGHCRRGGRPTVLLVVVPRPIPARHFPHKFKVVII